MIEIYPSALAHLNREYSPSNCISDIHIQQYIDLSHIAKNQARALKAMHNNLHYCECKTGSNTSDSLLSRLAKNFGNVSPVTGVLWTKKVSFHLPLC